MRLFGSLGGGSKWGTGSLWGRLWKLDFFDRGTDAALVRLVEKESVGRARLPSNTPSSVFLLADFCFGGRVTSADIFANSGLGSRLISSSGFFTSGLMVLERKRDNVVYAVINRNTTKILKYIYKCKYILDLHFLRERRSVVWCYRSRRSCTKFQRKFRNSFRILILLLGRHTCIMYYLLYHSIIYC